MFHLSDCARPCIVIDTHSIDKDKLDPSHLYLHQRHTVEIIQLTEVAAPSPSGFPSSPIDSGSVASSSSCYTTDTEPDYPTDEVESACSSYCSSDVPETKDSPRDEEEQAPKPDETYDIRAIRVRAWRASSASDMTFSPAGTYYSRIILYITDTSFVDILPVVNLAKRKASDENEVDTETVSIPVLRLPHGHRPLLCLGIPATEAFALIPRPCSRGATLMHSMRYIISHSP